MRSASHSHSDLSSLASGSSPAPQPHPAFTLYTLDEPSLSQAVLLTLPTVPPRPLGLAWHLLPDLFDPSLLQALVASLTLVSRMEQGYCP